MFDKLLTGYQELLTGATLKTITQSVVFPFVQHHVPQAKYLGSGVISFKNKNDDLFFIHTKFVDNDLVIQLVMFYDTIYEMIVDDHREEEYLQMVEELQLAVQ